MRQPGRSVARGVVSAWAAAVFAAGMALAKEPTWFVEKGTWVETYLESLNAVCREEAAAGQAIPADRNTGSLPLVLYPETNAGLGDVRFKLDVAGVRKLYVGSRRWMQIRDGKLITASGAETPLAEKNNPAVPYTLIQKNNRGRVHVRNDFQVGECEAVLELGGKYKWLEGTLRSRDLAVFWIDVKPRYEQWGLDLSRARREIKRRAESVAEKGVEDRAEREETRRVVDRNWRALPTVRRPMDCRQVAAVYAAAFPEAFGRTDDRIVAAVGKAAANVRTGGDLDRLMRLGQAGHQFRRVQHLRGRAASTKECPALGTAFEPIERAFLRFDPARLDYGLELTRKLDAFEDLVEECVEAAAYVQIARDTIDYVDRVQPVPDATRRRLEALAEALDRNKNDLSAFLATRDEIRRLRRGVLFTHPALDFDRILINRCPPTAYSHNGDQHLGRHSRVGPGLTILSDWKSDKPQARAILAGKLPVGSVRNPDLHYDAEKVVFAFCDHSRADRREHRRFFLYEAAVDGSWVRQLTGTKRDPLKTWHGRATVLIEDNDPAYLPGGDIVFVSTRSQTFGRCHGGRYNPAWVLHRCDANGGRIRQLSFGNENEYEPAVLNDGRIVFTRWEYTNRHEMYFHMLWWCYPDGTAVTHYYGNDTLFPMMVVEARPIPGTDRIVATAQGHHSYNTGTTVVLDTSRSENGEVPVRHVTPETPYSESRGWPSPHYSHPYPITEELFLVSRANHPVHHQGQLPPVADRGIYLVDPVGGRELIYEDPNVASFSPIPIRKRVRPPVLPYALPAGRLRHGTVFVQNVYRTRNDPEGVIRPGLIRAIRVNAIGVQPRAHRSGCSLTVPVEIPKRVVGTVPINPDGSAYFHVPAGTALQLQVLDANGMAVLTEKSFFYLQPGEVRSCVGCHEPESTSPSVATVPQSMRGRPTPLSPPAGPKYPGGLSFMRTVQPVLDRYCIRCHGLDRTEKGVNLVMDDWRRPQSCQAIIDRGDHQIGLKSYTGRGKNISRPRRYFAFRNRVAHMLAANHAKVNMDRDSYLRVIEWLDLNAQCFGDLFPYKLEERRIDPKALLVLREHVRERFGEKLASEPERALINVAQPDESRILMAPLAVEAGGWGQVPGFQSRSDPGYRKLAELVEKCIVRSDRENRNGWQPTLECGGGESWVMKAREAYREDLNAKP